MAPPQRPLPQERKSSPLCKLKAELETCSKPSTPPPKSTPPTAKKPDQLWAEKYRPQSVNELFGNKKAIQTLRDWLQHRKQFSGDPTVPLAALVHGPPGVGKTTTVHLLLKEFGYTAIEVNASEHRTKKIIMQTIVRVCTTDMDRGVHRALVLDEIDGAVSQNGDKRGAETSNSGVSAVVQFLTDAPHSKTKVAPIVCIANDVGSKGIRTLKEKCLTVRFYTAYSAESMLPLVEKICRSEGICMMPSDRLRLCRAANGDYRALVNALQFESLCPTHHQTTTSPNRTNDHADDLFVACQKLLTARCMPLREAERLCAGDSFAMQFMIQENYLRFLDRYCSAHTSDTKREALSALAGMFDDSDTTSTTSTPTKSSMPVDPLQTMIEMSDVFDVVSLLHNDDMRDTLVSCGSRTLLQPHRTHFPRPNEFVKLEFTPFLGTFSQRRSNFSVYEVEKQKLAMHGIDDACIATSRHSLQLTLRQNKHNLQQVIQKRPKEKFTCTVEALKPTVERWLALKPSKKAAAAFWKTFPDEFSQLSSAGGFVEIRGTTKTAHTLKMHMGAEGASIPMEEILRYITFPDIDPPPKPAGEPEMDWKFIDKLTLRAAPGHVMHK